MPILAVYIIPRETHAIYRIGASFLGYDVRTGALSKPLLSDAYDQVESWIGQARSFGFHATLGDALEYTQESLPEIKTRLDWIARRVPPFSLVKGRFHDSLRSVPRTLAATYDSPDGTLDKLHYLVVTLVNVLYHSSPYFDVSSYPQDQTKHIIRYGVPRHRILDQFDLHFSFATGIPNQHKWEELKTRIVNETGLFSDEKQRTLNVDEIHLLERQASGYFRTVATFPLLGEPRQKSE